MNCQKQFSTGAFTGKSPQNPSRIVHFGPVHGVTLILSVTNFVSRLWRSFTCLQHIKTENQSQLVYDLTIRNTIIFKEAYYRIMNGSILRWSYYQEKGDTYEPGSASPQGNNTFWPRRTSQSGGDHPTTYNQKFDGRLYRFRRSSFAWQTIRAYPNKKQRKFQAHQRKLFVKSMHRWRSAGFFPSYSTT